MTDEEIIEKSRRAWEEEVRFFSEAGKKERERWVVSDFLKKLSILTSEDDLVSPEQDDDIDVMFRDANFQVKEITEADCRRHAEAKESLRRTKNATQLSHLMPPMIAEDIAWDDVYPLILERAGDVKYPRSSRGKLDLLFYVTRRHAVIKRRNFSP